MGKIISSQDFSLTNSCTELSFSLWVFIKESKNYFSMQSAYFAVTVTDLVKSSKKYMLSQQKTFVAIWLHYSVVVENRRKTYTVCVAKLIYSRTSTT